MYEVGYSVFNLLLFFGLIALILYGILSTRSKMPSSKRKLYLLGLVSALIFALVPLGGVDDEFSKHFGYPAEVFVYRRAFGITFKPFHFIINFFLFYWFFIMTVKFLRLFTASKES